MDTVHRFMDLGLLLIIVGLIIALLVNVTVGLVLIVVGLVLAVAR